MPSKPPDAPPAIPASTQRAPWFDALDSLGLPLLLLDTQCREIHRTAALDTILSQEQTSARRQILAFAGQAARRQIERAGSCRTDGAPQSPVLEKTDAADIAVSASWCYAIRTACVDGPADFDTPLVVLVAVERRIPRVPSTQELRTRFGLTRREAEVALLLAQRRQNVEIAEMLCMSVHTARHHTERILEKLDIRHRARVMQVLQDVNNVVLGLITLCLLETSGFVFKPVAAGLGI